MNVVIRSDASLRIGMGHLARCLSLADALRLRGVNVSFICRAHSGSMLEVIRKKHFSCVVLKQPEVEADLESEDYAAWLGVSQRSDADDTISALNGIVPDWLIVDHYSLDHVWEGYLRPHAKRIMVIDDLANRTHDCDLLLDQNYAVDLKKKYTDLVPSQCMQLLGPSYALLRPEYRQFRRENSFKVSSDPKILVFFGGSDLQNFTSMTLRALSQRGLKSLQVEVVIGKNNPNRAEIEVLAKRRTKTRVHVDLPHLAELMANCELAIGAGGATSWERMCLGLPCIVVSMADNQMPATSALAKAGLIRYAGHYDQITVEELENEVRGFLSDVHELVISSQIGQLMVDGLGVDRVVEALIPNPTNQLTLRPACEGDAQLCFQFQDSDPMMQGRADRYRAAWASYKESFLARLDNETFATVIFLSAGIPVGYMQFENMRDITLVDCRFGDFYRKDEAIVDCIPRAVRMIEGVETKFLDPESGDDVSGFVAGFLSFRTDKNPTENKREPKKISIVSDSGSWINEYLSEIQLKWIRDGCSVRWVHDPKNIIESDFSFFLSCGKVVSKDVLKKSKHNLVVHESDLPEGKGWSPLTWQILEGANRIPATLFEAAECVDSGPIYSQEWMECDGGELIDELRLKQVAATQTLCEKFIENYPDILAGARAQAGDQTFYRRRNKADSKLSIEKPLLTQFNLLRVVDNKRYPAFFEFGGRQYILQIYANDQIDD